MIVLCHSRTGKTKSPRRCHRARGAFERHLHVAWSNCGRGPRSPNAALAGRGRV